MNTAHTMTAEEIDITILLQVTAAAQRLDQAKDRAGNISNAASMHAAALALTEAQTALNTAVNIARAAGVEVRNPKRMEAALAGDVSCLRA